MSLLCLTKYVKHILRYKNEINVSTNPIILPLLSLSFILVGVIICVGWINGQRKNVVLTSVDVVFHKHVNCLFLPVWGLSKANVSLLSSCICDISIQYKKRYKSLQI